MNRSLASSSAARPSLIVTKPTPHSTLFLEDEAIRLVHLVKENRKLIAEAQVLIAELEQTIEECQIAAQARRDALNPKIIPLPRSVPGTAKIPLPKQPGEI